MNCDADADVGGDRASFHEPPTSFSSALSFQPMASLPSKPKTADTLSSFHGSRRESTDAGSQNGAESRDEGSAARSQTPSLLRSLNAVIASAAARDAAAISIAVAMAADKGATKPKATKAKTSSESHRQKSIGGISKADGEKNKGSEIVADVPAASSASAVVAATARVVPLRPARNLRTIAHEPKKKNEQATATTAAVRNRDGDHGSKGAPHRPTAPGRSEGTKKRMRVTTNTANASPNGTKLLSRQNGALPCSPPARRTGFRGGLAEISSTEELVSGTMEKVKRRASAVETNKETATTTEEFSSEGDALGAPTGMELIPGFEDTIDSPFMTALLQSSNAQSGAVPANDFAEGDASEKQKTGWEKEESKDGGGVDVSLDLAESLLERCNTQPSDTTDFSKVCQAPGHVHQQQTSLLESLGLGAADLLISGASCTIDGPDVAWGLAEECEEDDGQLTKMSKALAMPKTESVDEMPSPPPPSSLDVVPESSTVSEPGSQRVTTDSSYAEKCNRRKQRKGGPAATAATAATPAVSLISSERMAGDVTQAATSEEQKSNETSNVRTRSSTRKQQVESPDITSATTLVRTARERAKEEAQTSVTDKETSEAIVQRRRRGSGATGVLKGLQVSGAGVAATIPDVKSHSSLVLNMTQEVTDTVEGVCRHLAAPVSCAKPSTAGVTPNLSGSSCVTERVSDTEIKGTKVDEREWRSMALPLQKKLPTPSLTSPSKGEVPGGAMDKASDAVSTGGDSGSFAAPATQVSCMVSRSLPRKVALQFAPRDDFTEQKLSEQGYRPLQKLTAPVCAVFSLAMTSYYVKSNLTDKALLTISSKPWCSLNDGESRCRRGTRDRPLFLGSVLTIKYGAGQLLLQSVCFMTE